MPSGSTTLNEAAIAEALASNFPNHLTKAEWLVILAIRQIPFGSVEVQIRDGIPVFLGKIEKIKLTT